jgi:uncharacterized membrane protein (DUF485 family)
MPFQEKSAWIMSIILIVAGACYFSAVAAIGAQTGQMALPMMPLVIRYTVMVVVLSVVGQVAIAILSPKEANASLDERERQIVHRAGHYSSYFFAVGVVMSLGYYLFSHNGDLLFYTVFASLMVGHVVEYLNQILLYRTSV